MQLGLLPGRSRPQHLGGVERPELLDALLGVVGRARQLARLPALHPRVVAERLVHEHVGLCGVEAQADHLRLAQPGLVGVPEAREVLEPRALGPPPVPGPVGVLLLARALVQYVLEQLRDFPHFGIAGVRRHQIRDLLLDPLDPPPPPAVEALVGLRVGAADAHPRLQPARRLGGAARLEVVRLQELGEDLPANLPRCASRLLQGSPLALPEHGPLLGSLLEFHDVVHLSRHQPLHHIVNPCAPPEFGLWARERHQFFSVQAPECSPVFHLDKVQLALNPQLHLIFRPLFHGFLVIHDGYRKTQNCNHLPFPVLRCHNVLHAPSNSLWAPSDPSSFVTERQATRKGGID
mmetsp:Transcript_51061/g.127152  ORF Transcript_51061/g.127152 Transcript_51061/m.127152 type:complete len:349 (-) Transcript_51061:1793-2839(-)